MKAYASKSLKETSQIASDWLGRIANLYGNNEEAMLVGLSGHLGSGKTAFVKLLAKEMGIAEDITSPTFVIMKMYEIKADLPWKRLVHIDAYRLEKREELVALDWEGLVGDKNNLIMMEWPENAGLKEFLPEASLGFEIVDDKRNISIS